MLQAIASRHAGNALQQDLALSGGVLAFRAEEQRSRYGGLIRSFFSSYSANSAAMAW